MKRTFVAGALVLISVALVSCGGHNSTPPPPPTTTTQILSEPTFDGYIVKDAVTSNFTVTQGSTQSVFAGIDPATGNEFRAFLDFPLTGAGGGVPGNAVIVSAFLDFVINSISPQPLIGTIPIRIDLVSFQPPTLLGTDFDRTLQPAILTTTIEPPIAQSDFGNHVTIDITPFMTQVQQLGLPDFQIRILEDLGAASPGTIEIDDTTGPNRGLLAPLLQVEYQ